MKNYFKIILFGISLAFLNACTEQLKFDLVTENIARNNEQLDLRRYYMVSNYKDDGAFDQQMDDFANKIADTTKNRYTRVVIRFYRGSDKTDLRALKEGNTKPNEVDELLTSYLWYKGKLLTKEHKKM
jgi:hypothetical protein